MVPRTLVAHKTDRPYNYSQASHSVLLRELYISFFIIIHRHQDRSPVPTAQRWGFCHPEGNPSGADVTR